MIIVDWILQTLTQDKVQRKQRKPEKSWEEKFDSFVYHCSVKNSLSKMTTFWLWHFCFPFEILITKCCEQRALFKMLNLNKLLFFRRNQNITYQKNVYFLKKEIRESRERKIIKHKMSHCVTFCFENRKMKKKIVYFFFL